MNEIKQTIFEVKLDIPVAHGIVLIKQSEVGFTVHQNSMHISGSPTYVCHYTHSIHMYI